MIKVKAVLAETFSFRWTDREVTADHQLIRQIN